MYNIKSVKGKTSDNNKKKVDKNNSPSADLDTIEVVEVEDKSTDSLQSWSKNKINSRNITEKSNTVQI